MKIRKSFRLSPISCDDLSLISHHFGISETAILEHAISGIFVFFKDFSADLYNDDSFDFESFCDYFGYSVSRVYNDFFRRYE